MFHCSWSTCCEYLSAICTARHHAFYVQPLKFYSQCLEVHKTKREQSDRLSIIRHQGQFQEERKGQANDQNIYVNFLPLVRNPKKVMTKEEQLGTNDCLKFNAALICKLLHNCMPSLYSTVNHHLSFLDHNIIIFTDSVSMLVKRPLLISKRKFMLVAKKEERDLFLTNRPEINQNSAN